jgi:DNA-binding response OmpR family regulator/signal transduction histidine kinase
MRTQRIRVFFREAKRRRIYTTAVAYIAIAAGIIEVAGSVFQAWGFRPWAMQLLITVLLLAFPFVLVLGWIFDIGLKGIHRTPDLMGAGAPAPWRARALPTEVRKKVEVIEEAPDPERVRRATLAFVRHELRTPVNAMIGYSEMLLEDAEETGDTEAAADLKRIGTCSRQILRELEAILSTERILSEQGRDLDSYAMQIRADLRDPLGAIVGYAEMLVESSEEAGKTSRIPDLQRILRASHTLLELSNDIAALATQAPDAIPSQMMQGATLAHGALSKIRSVDHDVSAHTRTGALLVVDDSATNRDLLARQLARRGYIVDTAASGADALERMGQQRFDLVLLDVLMPDLDGVGVLLRMKNDVRLAEIPVIMLSALDEVDSIVRCLELGATDFVSKPFHPTILDARIQTALQAFASRMAAPQHASPVSSDSALERLVAGSVPDYIGERVLRGQSRQLDGVVSAAACFVDLDFALAATDPAERARLTEILIEAARDACRAEDARVLLQGIGLVMVAGFPEPAIDASVRIARTALAFMENAERDGLRLRAGMHTGSVYAALVGQENLSYWVWGDAIDLSRRLALSADRATVSISAATQAALKDAFDIGSKGVIEVPGRGQMRAYILQRPAAATAAVHVR